MTKSNAQHKKSEDELNDAIENQRVEKDAAIKQLTSEKEEIRKKAEVEIDQLSKDLKISEFQLTELKGSVIALTAELARKNDVESQLDTQRTRSTQLDDQKLIL